MALCAANTRGAAAQQSATALARDDRTRVVVPPDSESARGTVRVVGAAPRTFQIVSVGIPAEVPAGRSVHYAIEPTGRVPILGARTGTVDAIQQRAVLVTVGIPANMLAGRVAVASVVFTSDNIAPVRVPIDLVVPVRRGIELRSVRPRVGVAPGRTVTLRIDVTNNGNADDTLAIVADGPGDWRIGVSGAVVLVLRPGETESREIRVTVPTVAGIGEGSVTVRATAAAVERARESLTVEVGGASAHGPRTATMTNSILTSRDEVGNQHATGAVIVNGLVAPGLDMSGQFTTRLPTDAAMRLAQTTFGYSDNSNFISLLGQHWGASAGTTNLVSSPLAGQNVMGEGGSLMLRADSSTVRVIAVRPFGESDIAARRDVSVAARGELVGSGGAVSAFYTHMHDDLFSPRALDAFGVGGRVSPWTRSTFSAEVAERRYAGGRGLGISSDFGGEVLNTRTDVRVLHAPGGASAFAQARDVVSANFIRTDFRRLSSAASAWWTADRNATFSSLDSRGGAFSTSLALPLHLEVGTDLRRVEFSSADSMGRFRSNQSGYAARLGARAGGVSWSGDVYQDVYTQEALPYAGSSIAMPSTVTGVRGQVRFDLLRGSLGVDGSSEQRVSAYGPEARQIGYGVHADRLRVLPLVPGVTLSGSLWRVSYGHQGLDSRRAALNVELTPSMRLVLAAQQDALLRSASGRPRTIFSLKAERGATVPFVNRAAAAGVVFEDLDGDGRRDGGEPGIPGIIVRRDGEAAITDRHGEYRFRQPTAGPVSVDQRSLPRGWLLSAAPLDARAAATEFGVIPVVSLEVRVVTAASSERGGRTLTLGPVTVGVRDAAGREWVAKANASGRVVFDALPPGRYQLEVEAPAASEPVVFDPIPTIDLKASTESRRIEIVARPRPIRLLDPRSRQQRDKGKTEQPAGADSKTNPHAARLP
jgi:hypothetical protein